MTEITVIITTHNLENYIDSCLLQLKEQTFHDFEVLIVDDCSTDSTVERINHNLNSFPVPISVLSTPANLGAPGKSRNFALDYGQIHGRYLVFLDGDDDIEPSFLAQLYKTAINTGAEITLCSYDRIEDGTGHVLCREMQGFPMVIQLPANDDIVSFINGALWNKLILRDLVGKTRIPDFNAGEDLCFQLALIDKCSKIACIGEVLIHYRVRSASLMSNIKEETIHKFAGEIARLYQDTQNDWMHEILEEMAFIHIGISMPLRAYRNPDILVQQLLKWIEDYFAENYHWFKNCKWLRFRWLIKHGIKGYGLWGAKMCYRIHCFLAFLWCYDHFTKLTHKEIKF